MPADPRLDAISRLTGDPTAARIADLDRQRASDGRGEVKSAAYAEDLTSIAFGPGFTDAFGPSVKIRIGPSGGLLFAYGQMELGGDAANDVAATICVDDSTGLLLMQSNFLQTRSAGFAFVASYPGPASVAGVTAAGLGAGGPVCMGYFAAGLYTVRFRYYKLAGAAQGGYRNRRIVAWTP